MRNFELECADSEYEEKDGFVVAYFDVYGFPEELQDKYNPSTCGFVYDMDWNERYNGPEFATCEESDVMFYVNGVEVSKETFQKSLELTDEEVQQIIEETIVSAEHEANGYGDEIYNHYN